MKLTIPALSAWLLLSSVAVAADDGAPKHPLDLKYDQCIDADGSTAGTHQCLEQFLPLWDKELNKYYGLLGGDRNGPLRKAQMAWIAYRNAETAWISQKYQTIYDNSGGGTMWGMLEHTDIFELTRKRALELKEAYEMIEGKF